MDSQELEEGPLEVELVVREADGTERVLWAGELPAEARMRPWAPSEPHKPGDRYILRQRVMDSYREIDPERIKVWRNGSPPAFTAATPGGSHAAWWFAVDGRPFGPYYSRRDAEAAACVFLAGENEL